MWKLLDEEEHLENSSFSVGHQFAWVVPFPSLGAWVAWEVSELESYRDIDLVGYQDVNSFVEAWDIH